MIIAPLIKKVCVNMKFSSVTVRSYKNGVKKLVFIGLDGSEKVTYIRPVKPGIRSRLARFPSGY